MALNRAYTSIISLLPTHASKQQPAPAAQPGPRQPVLNLLEDPKPQPFTRQWSFCVRVNEERLPSVSNSTASDRPRVRNSAGNATLASEADSGSIDAGLRLFRGSSGCTYLLWEVSTEA